MLRRDKVTRRQLISDIIFQVESQRQLFQSQTLSTSETCECRIAGFKTINKKKISYLAWLPSLHQYSKLSRAMKDDFAEIQEKYKNQKQILLKSTIILSDEQVNALLSILLKNENDIKVKYFENSFQQSKSNLVSDLEFQEMQN